MLYFVLEKAGIGFPKGQIRRKAETQSQWVPMESRDSQVAEETIKFKDPKDLPLGFLFTPLEISAVQKNRIKFLTGFTNEREKMRPPRIYKEDTVYYITAGASGRELLFQDESDYKEFLEILKTRKVKYNFKLYSYCLVPQHYYFLIEPQTGSASISKIMQAINTSYSLYFNKKYGRIGHLIGGRFESRLFNRDAALLEQTVNMHLTPWQLKRALNLEDYKWSSYTEYIQADRQEFLTDKEFIFSFLDTTDKEAQVNKYKELIEQRKTEIATQAKETEEATGVSLSGETEQSFFNYRLGYILLAVALVGSLVILPNFLGRKVNKHTLEQALNKEADVNLPEGLAFYPAHTSEKKVWELWKLGPWNKLGEANELAQ